MVGYLEAMAVGLPPHLLPVAVVVEEEEREGDGEGEEKEGEIPRNKQRNTLINECILVVLNSSKVAFKRKGLKKGGKEGEEDSNKKRVKSY